MEKYLGVKMIQATPATHGEYSVEKYGESSNSEFSIQNKNSEGYKVVYEDGYVSWSPKEVFEKAYRPITNLTFGLAIEALKKGDKVVRQGWNGKGIFVVYQKGIPSNKQTAEAFGINEGDLFVCNPYLQLKNPDGSASMWFPSINDVLAEDWVIVDN